ncbi:MAG: putative oxidoreductase YdhV [Alphaproteobacteria bacterium MarineAlpha3_Bin4]|nr:MAG: putative oxidoreductase YdhV [Alphaproteobacteria bacterium MarineAlpha3_Bin4]
MGWQRKILRVNLTAGTAKGEPLNMDWAAKYLGQRGLATRYLMEEIDPTVDPLSPENKLIFASGPLTGTMSPTGGRWSVVTKGALTGAIACSNSGGHFGGELKLAGWDMIIFEGRAKYPVYLLIQDDKAELFDARKFIWGKTVWETEDRVKARHQDPLIRVASIGQAGENLVRFACVMNDRDRAAGRSGVGAVMGSKQLKAVALRGTKGVQPDNPKAFIKAVVAAQRKLAPAAKSERLSETGTMAMMDVTNAYGSLPTHNSRDVQFRNGDKVNYRAMVTPRRSDGQANLVTNKACFACTIGCGRVSRIDPEHFSIEGKEQYKSALGGLEYESGYALAPLVGVDDIEAATFANAVCNEHGMDPISFGGSLAAAMELFEEGAISEKDTGGLKLNFGSAKALVETVEMTGTGQGFGREIGLGSKLLCEKYEHPEFSMSVKGQEFPGYDGRAMQGMGLAYATSNRGACHLRAAPFTDDFAHVRTEGKAKVVKESQDEIAAVDSTGVCAFTHGALDLADFAEQIDAACQGEWTAERLAETGERIWNLERQFNLAAGFTVADDTLPQRILKDAAKTGAGKGRVAELSVMLPEYYELRGWDKKGVPKKATLKRLDLA